MIARKGNSAAQGKRLGLVTMLGGANYGSAFQSFSLFKVLESQGYDVRIITDFPNPNDGGLKKAARAMLLSVGLLQLRHRVLERSKIGKLKQKKIRAFHKENYKIAKAYTKNKLKRIVEETDLFISGSDQIWNVVQQYWPPYFLDFAQGKKRISYASSIGVSAIPDEYKSQMRNFLMKYQHIGVREETAVKVLQELTGRRDIVQVVDPTFLLTKDEWMKVAEGASLEFDLPRHYMLAYMVRENDQYYAQIKDVAAKAGLKDIILVRAGSSEPSDFLVEGARVYEDGGPKEFLRLLLSADLVCSDSFHGTVLSINFKKPFVVLPRFDDPEHLDNPDPATSQNSRFYDVLSRYGLMSQLYATDSDSFLELYNEVRAQGATGGGNTQRCMPFCPPTGNVPCAI